MKLARESGGGGGGGGTGEESGRGFANSVAGMESSNSKWWSSG